MNWRADSEKLLQSLKLSKTNEHLVHHLGNQLGKGLHLAVFSEPYLSQLLSGKKTLESRFSKNKISPYEKIFEDDIVLVKQTGGAIVGAFLAGEVEFYSEVTRDLLKQLKESYDRDLGTFVDSGFWPSKANSNFITLIRVKKYYKIQPFFIDKRDRTAWVVLKPNSKNKTLFHGYEI